MTRVAEERNVLAGLIVVAVNAILGVIFSAIFVLGGFARAQFDAGAQQPLPPEFQDFTEGVARFTEVATPISSAVFPFINWLVIALVMFLATRLFGREGSFSAMLAVVGVAAVVNIVASLVSFPLSLLQVSLTPETFDPQQGFFTAATILGLVSGLISLAFFVWYVVLVVIGAAKARNIGYGESTGACAISCAGCLGLIILVGVVIALVAALATGAFTPQ